MRRLTPYLSGLTGGVLMSVALVCQGVTGIDTAYVPLSAAGTDMMDEDKATGGIILAARPVIVGPVPESLVAAVFLPFRLERVVGETDEEANLARLSGIEAAVEAYTEHEAARIQIDLTHFDVGHLGLSKRQVLEATITAIQRTILCARNKMEGRYRFEFVGTSRESPDITPRAESVEIIASGAGREAYCPALMIDWRDTAAD